MLSSLLFVSFLALLSSSSAAPPLLHALHWPPGLRAAPETSSSAADFWSLALGVTAAPGARSSVVDPFKLARAALIVSVSNGDHVVNASLSFPLKESGREAFLRLKSRLSGPKLVLEADPSHVLVEGEGREAEALRRAVSESEESDIKRLFERAIDSLISSEKPLKSVLYFDLRVWPSEGAQLADALEAAQRRLADVFGDRLVVSVVEEAAAAPLVRRTRQTEALNATLNLAHRFQPDFHAAFATTAFTTLLMALSVYAVAVAMWHLDPGKDSIIYRMTSQRIKKDQ